MSGRTARTECTAPENRLIGTVHVATPLAFACTAAHEGTPEELTRDLSALMLSERQRIYAYLRAVQGPAYIHSQDSRKPCS